MLVRVGSTKLQPVLSLIFDSCLLSAIKTGHSLNKPVLIKVYNLSLVLPVAAVHSDS